MLSVRRLAQCAFWLLLSSAAHAADGPLHAKLLLSLPGDASTAASSVDVEVRSGADVRHVTASLPGDAAIDVPPGVTYVRVVAESYWSGSRAFDVRTENQILPVVVYPAGVIGGALVLADGEKSVPLVNTIVLGSERVAPWDKSITIPCSASGLQWSCVVPAGTQDIRLRVPGYISTYYWHTVVVAGKRLDLGEAKLQRGASVVGTVAADDAPRDARPTVALQPLRSVDDQETAKRLRIDSVRADERGFFHFDGIAPGAYSVVASLPGYASATGTARVVEGRESELLAPLRIEKAKALELAIDPALDPAGSRWNVALLATGGSIAATVTQGSAGMDGRFGWRGARGSYEVQVRSADGKLWADDYVTIDRDPARAQISIEPQQFHGVVRLADHPLRARLAFGQRNGPEAESGEDGKFSAFLPAPHDGIWHVIVSSETAGVHRQVTVHAPKDGEAVIIDLPGGRIAGVVNDEQGNGVEDAIVTVTNGAADPFWTQVRSGPGGVFQLAGLDGDKYALVAEGAGGQSESVSITLSEEDDRRIEMTLHPHHVIRGVVLSPYGAVAGAEVYIVPLQGTVSNRLHYTNEAGEFAATVPPGTDAIDVSVSAPGFARTFFRTHYQEGRDLQLRVGQTGGTLTIDVPRSLQLPTTNWTYLLQGEARIMLGTAQRWGVVQPPSADDRYTLDVPQLEAGPYLLCATPAGGIENMGPLDPKRCVSGVLAPYGRLTLRLPFAPSWPHERQP